MLDISSSSLIPSQQSKMIQPLNQDNVNLSQLPNTSECFSNPTLRFPSSSGIVLARQDGFSRLKLKRMIVFGSGSIHISWCTKTEVEKSMHWSMDHELQQSRALCVRAKFNHAPIEEYGRHFIPSVHSCPCGQGDIETRSQILINYRRSAYKSEDWMFMKNFVSFQLTTLPLLQWTSSKGYVYHS